MSSERPLGLRELAEVESPELVRGALRRFRRRFALWAALFAASVIGLTLLVTGPDRGRSVPSEFAGARPTSVMAVARERDVRITVLDAARLESTYVLHAVVVVDGLALGEGVFIGRQFAVWSSEMETSGAGADTPPPPGPPADIGGMVRASDSGFGAHPAQEIWLEIPLGRQRVTVTVAAGVPAGTGPSESEVAPPRRPTAELVLEGPPIEPGTGRVLAEVTLDVRELGIPQHIWEGSQ